MAERAKAQPLLLFLDEAHTLTPEAGRLLLNAAQEVGNSAPFLLVLAGTPDLPARLSEMSASFWGRAEKIRLGRLEEGPTAEAIRRPLRDEGIALDEDALARIVRESHGYPYFTQLWGRALWVALRRAPGSGDRVTPEVLEAAFSLFEEKRDDYYLDRYFELDKRGYSSRPPGKSQTDSALAPCSTTPSSGKRCAAPRRRSRPTARR